MKCSVLYNVDGLRMSIYECYSWEMTLNASLEIFDNL
jgi:hypothetical protein